MTNLQEKMCAECLEHEENLNAWEIDFLDSIIKNQSNKDLSEKQIATLNKINTKAVFS